MDDGRNECLLNNSGADRYTLLPYCDIMQENDLQELISNARTLRALMQSDPHRPTYHFVAPEGHAMPFDPNGALYWKGKYHLGYIYQKEVDEKKIDVWGHAVSTDLLHWTIYPDMLDVKDGDMEEGIFSGGAFVSRSNVPHVIYYGKGASANLMAYAMDDELKVWKKFEHPVLKSLSPIDPIATVCCTLPKGKYSVFDPDAWYDEQSDCYYQISGGMKPALFKSVDMHEWEYLGSIVGERDPLRNRLEDISCPDFFPLGDKWMLVFLSHARGVQYYIGSFTNDKFTPERHGRMNWPGGGFFAPEQLRDATGRNIIFGWVKQPKSTAPQRDYGWSGIMSLPRVVSLNNEGELAINPAEEIELIRLKTIREDEIVLHPHESRTLKACGKSIELKIKICGGTQSSFGVKVFASPDGREETVIRYEPDKQELVIDFSKSSIYGPVTIPVIRLERQWFTERVMDYVSEQRAPLKLNDGEALELDIFLDRSIIEVFANGRQAVTQIVYPELESSTGITVFSGEETLTVYDIQSWSMAETNAC